MSITVRGLISQGGRYVLAVLAEFPLRVLRVSVVNQLLAGSHHGDTENTENRTLFKLGHY